MRNRCAGARGTCPVRPWGYANRRGLRRDGYNTRPVDQMRQLVGTRDVLGATGLSSDQLREWTGRRGLVVPDIRAQGKGTHPRFSWQTALVLRFAAELKDVFHLELQA